MERTHLRYAVPLSEPGGTLSEHFGEAPYFGLVTLRLTDGAIEQQQVIANPYTEVEKAKGIQVAEWLVAQKVDVVLLKQSLRGKGPTYVFGDERVEMQETTATTLEEALAPDLTPGPSPDDETTVVRRGERFSPAPGAFFPFGKGVGG